LIVLVLTYLAAVEKLKADDAKTTAK